MGNKDLTKRESEVLRLTAQGYSSSDIGKLFGTKEVSVRHQKHSAYTKLGARNMAHAITIAWSQGLLR